MKFQEEIQYTKSTIISVFFSLTVLRKRLLKAY